MFKNIFTENCHVLSSHTYLYIKDDGGYINMRKKVVITVLITGAWLTGRANAGSSQVVATHRMESGTGAVRSVAEDIDVVLNQWPVWNAQKISEELVQEYLDNSMPGVYFAEIADIVTIHIYLTRRARRRNRLFCTAIWKRDCE